MQAPCDANGKKGDSASRSGKVAYMAGNDIPVEQLFQGVLKIRLPTPYKVGDVNAYIFIGMGCFDIIDPGCGSKPNLLLLEEVLSRFGLRLSHARRIFLTHGHEDHGGLSSEISAVSGATISLGHGDKNLFGTNVRKVFLSNRDRVTERFHRLGFPGRDLELLPDYFEARDYYNTPPARTEGLSDGEYLTAGNTRLKAIAAHGHTQGSVCYYLEEAEALFSGDTLIDHITPNPGASIYYDILFQDEVDYNPLGNFLNTLDRLKDLDPKVAYSGHGKTVENPRELIDGYLDHHKKRLRQILSSLDDGPLTCYDVSSNVFGNCNKIDETVLQVMEVYAHLIYLVEEGQVMDSLMDAGCRMYKRTGL